MSENVVYPTVPNGFADHYPYEKWLAIIGNINPTFSGPKPYKSPFLMGKSTISMAIFHLKPSDLFEVDVRQLVLGRQVGQLEGVLEIAVLHGIVDGLFFGERIDERQQLMGICQ